MKIVAIVFSLFQFSFSSQSISMPSSASIVTAMSCGISFSPTMSYKTVSSFCTAQVAGSKLDFIVIQFSNMNANQAYVVTNKKQTAQGYLLTFKSVGILQGNKLIQSISSKPEFGKVFVFNNYGKYAVRGSVQGSDIFVRSLNPSTSLPLNIRTQNQISTAQPRRVNYSCVRSDRQNDETMNILISNDKSTSSAEVLIGRQWVTFQFVKRNGYQFIFSNAALRIGFVVSDNGQTGQAALYSTNSSQDTQFTCQRGF